MKSNVKFWIIALVAALLSACGTTSTPISPTLTSVPDTPTPFSPDPTSPPPTAQVPTETLSPVPSPTQSPTPISTPEPNTVRFAVIGDYGRAGSDEEAVSNLVKSWNPDLIITTGDNNYPDGSADTIDQNIGQYYHEYIHPYVGQYGEGAEVNRFFPSLGNHDWHAPNVQPFLDYFTLPGNERYYDFVWGPVHFFALDGDGSEPDGVGSSSVQAQWLKEGLAASNAPWKIVYSHFPPYSSARHGSVDWMQWPYQEWGATAALSGHDHVYERLVIDGFPYFTNGLGGHPSRYFFFTSLDGSQVQFRSEHGAMLVEADESRITFQFITVSGEVIDAYTIEKNAANFEERLQNATSLPDTGSYRWEPIASGFNQPTLVTHSGDGEGRLFVVEQPGTIRVVQDGQVLAEPFLDIQGSVTDAGNEQGLLGLAFHPNFTQNGYFYINYTESPNGNTAVDRFQVSPENPNKADPGSQTRVLSVEQPYRNHNGGHLEFGPDGYLYIGLGDGGSAGDPQGNAQNPNTLLGSILRLDVDADSPQAPTDNPFTAGGGNPLVWALGLRNPWRFSFDKVSGDMFIGDVGQNVWEEIDYLPAGSPGGANFGWDYLEGTHPYEGTPPSDKVLLPPIEEYSHDEGGCSVTGGGVYRGRELPEFYGIYLYGDYCSGIIWGLVRNENGDWQNSTLFRVDARLTSFGVDENGEIYLVAREGVILRLTRQ